MAPHSSQFFEKFERSPHPLKAFIFNAFREMDTHQVR